MKCTWSLILLIAVIMIAGCSKPPESPYLDASLSVQERVDDLVGRMTLEEKISQMRYDAPAVERLGIPTYNWWNECLHGLGRAGLATVFPQAIGMAATWNEDLLHRVATVISDEARAKHHTYARLGKRQIYQGLTFWTPNINIFRDPRWGRGQETYGEDPFLTGRLAVNFIRGLQGDDPRYLKLVATSKHFAVHSGPESTRHTFDARVSDRDIYETYLPAFKATVQEAGVASVMCAYNRFMGEPCCGSGTLMQSILRDEWGFDGYIVTDCWAVVDFFRFHRVVETPEESAAMAVRNGSDLNCGTTYRRLPEAVVQGLLTEAEIDRAVKRLFRARFRLGMFDEPNDVPYAQIPYEVISSDEHRALALQTARESMILLKNDGLLPLNKNLGTVAVIGPNARNYQSLLGNYNGTPRDVRYPVDAIREKLGSDTDVLYAEGADIAAGIPSLSPIPAAFMRTADGRHGLDASYYDNMNWEGEPALVRVDSSLDFIWKDTTPITGVMADTFSVRWTGMLTAPVTGTYKIGFNGASSGAVFLDDSLLVRFSNDHHPVTRTFDVDLVAGVTYDLRADFYNYGSDPQAHLVWAVPGRDLPGEAMEAARASDVVILVLGLSPDLEGEQMDVEIEGFSGGDRTRLDLPESQQDLMRQVVGLGKPTVLVLMSGSAVAIPWAAENIPAIVQAWYPGEAGGQAVADVLFGDYNPGGRLPVTMYRSVDDLPAFDDYNMQNRTYRYYRGEVLFPFGHGLSYTNFRYANLELPERADAGDDVTVSVDVTNTGTAMGDEVVQLYVSYPDAHISTPIRSLKGFRRIHLAPGETQNVSFMLDSEALSVVDDSGAMTRMPGSAEITVGGKQPGFSRFADAGTTMYLSETIKIEE